MEAHSLVHRQRSGSGRNKGGTGLEVRKEQYDTGDWYYGEFKGELRHGKGLYVYAEGPTKEYEGDWKDGYGDGNGVFRFADGGHYEGEVKEGEMGGCGKWVQGNGGVYAGNMENGLMHGRGVFTSANKQLVYAGEWEKGKKCGQGKLTLKYEDGGLDEYVGAWHNNLMHGQGEYRYRNGDVYVGQFERGKRCGSGTMTYKRMPGEVTCAAYKGEWRGDKYHGRGIFTHAGGDKVEDAMWVDGNRRANMLEPQWWDDRCFICAAAVSPGGQAQILCCELCPNVAHMECINQRRTAEGVAVLEDVPTAYFCGEHNVSTGVRSTPEGKVELPAATGAGASAPAPLHASSASPLLTEPPLHSAAPGATVAKQEVEEEVLPSGANCKPVTPPDSEASMVAREAEAPVDAATKVHHWLATSPPPSPNKRARAPAAGAATATATSSPLRPHTRRTASAAALADMVTAAEPRPASPLAAEPAAPPPRKTGSTSQRTGPVVRVSVRLGAKGHALSSLVGDRVATPPPTPQDGEAPPPPPPPPCSSPSAIAAAPRVDSAGSGRSAQPLSPGSGSARERRAASPLPTTARSLTPLPEELAGKSAERAREGRRETRQGAPTKSPTVKVEGAVRSSRRSAGRGTGEGDAAPDALLNGGGNGDDGGSDAAAAASNPLLSGGGGAGAIRDLHVAMEAAMVYVQQLEAENQRLRERLESAALPPAPTCLPTYILTSITMLHHHTPETCPERRDRVLLLHQDLCRNPWHTNPFGGGGVRWESDPPPATHDHLALVHDQDYLHFMCAKAESAKFREGGMSSMSEVGDDASVHETAISSHSVDAVLAAAGCVLRAVDQVAAREARNAFCLIRPPGHHSASSHSLRRSRGPLNPQGIGAGFCLVNNVLIGAKYAKDKYQWRVAVVDFDAHHGNGTEQVIRYGKLKDENGIMLCSIHQYNKNEFPGTGGRESMERNAEDGGAPWIINIPIPYLVPKQDREVDDLDSAHWRRKVVQNLLPHIKAFEPDLVLMSAGFDAHKDDPIGHLKLVEDDFGWITKALVSTQAVGATVPHVVSVLEGGYGIDEASSFSLSRSACAHVQALSELPCQGSVADELDFDLEQALAMEGVSGRLGLTKTRARNASAMALDSFVQRSDSQGSLDGRLPAKRPKV